MKHISFLIALLLGSGPLSAQIDQFVIGSLGGQIENTNYNLIHSVGEVAGTQIGSGPSLLQGFPQCFIGCGPNSLEDLIANPQVKIFPNPTTGLIYLKGESQLLDYYELINTTGQQLRTAGLLHSQIDLSQLPIGMYLLRIYGREQELTFLGKVVVE